MTASIRSKQTSFLLKINVRNILSLARWSEYKPNLLGELNAKEKIMRNEGQFTHYKKGELTLARLSVLMIGIPNL